MRASSASTSPRSSGTAATSAAATSRGSARAGAAAAPARRLSPPAPAPRASLASPPGGTTPDLASVASAAPIRRASSGVGSTGSPRTAPSHTVRVAASYSSGSATAKPSSSRCAHNSACAASSAGPESSASTFP